MTIKQEFDTACRKLIRGKGNSIGMNSLDCKQWMTSHENCSGCQHEMGCSQLVGLGLASMDVDPIGKVDRIINAKTSKEVRETPFNCVMTE